MSDKNKLGSTSFARKYRRQTRGTREGQKNRSSRAIFIPFLARLRVPSFYFVEEEQESRRKGKGTVEGKDGGWDGVAMIPIERRGAARDAEIRLHGVCACNAYRRLVFHSSSMAP